VCRRAQESRDVSEDAPHGCRPRRWTGRFFLDAGRALYVGKVFETTRHAHHAIQACVGLEGPVRLRAQAERRWRHYDAVVVRADAPHELAGDARTMGLLFIEPESRDGRRLQLPTGQNVMPLRSEQVRRLRVVLNGTLSRSTGHVPSEGIIRELLEAIGLEASDGRELHPHVARALVLLDERVADLPGSADLARFLKLSPDRLRHLFTREMGLTCRRYRLWLRLKTAVEGIRGGASLTEAAHAAGFADSAHLTRTFRQMFGIAPSSALPIFKVGQPSESSTEAARRTASR
jgi:AraC family transcriptional regulator